MLDHRMLDYRMLDLPTTTTLHSRLLFNGRHVGVAGVAAMDVHPSQQCVRGRVRGVVVAAGVHRGVPARVGVGMDVANTVGMET